MNKADPGLISCSSHDLRRMYTSLWDLMPKWPHDAIPNERLEIDEKNFHRFPTIKCKKFFIDFQPSSAKIFSSISNRSELHSAAILVSDPEKLYTYDVNHNPE